MNKLYIAASCDLGVHIDGTRLGPRELLNEYNSDLVKYFLTDETIKKSKDKSDLHKNYDELYAYLKNLYDYISNLDTDTRVITVGGDHSIAIPTALAANKKYGNLGLIWIDAHTDYHTMDSTTSGNLHGLPCAAINNYGADDLSKYHNGSYISSANTVIVGARSIDEGEYVNLKNTNVTLIPMEEVKRRGIKECLDEAFKIASDNTDGVHVSYDLDFLDPSIAPGVSTPVLNGGDMAMFEIILESLKEHKDLIKAFDLVELNPLNDVNGKTKSLAKRIIDIF